MLLFVSLLLFIFPDFCFEVSDDIICVSSIILLLILPDVCFEVRDGKAISKLQKVPLIPLYNNGTTPLSATEHAVTSAVI